MINVMVYLRLNDNALSKGLFRLIKNKVNSLPDHEYISQARRWQTKNKEKWIDNLIISQK